MKTIKLLQIVPLLLVAAGCASMAVDLPSITSAATGERHPGKIVWRDLLTSDPAASARFYGELFGWEFEPVGSAAGLGSDSAYTLIRHHGELIGGMVDTVALNGRTDLSQWIALMAVADIDAAVSTVADGGGTVIAGPRDFSRRGRIAVASDAEGAIFGLLQTRDGDPADREPAVGGFLWEELWTTDVDGMAAFYERVGGLQAGESRQAAGSGYTVLRAGDRPRVGIMAAPLPDLKPVWVSYVRVEDPAAITARVAGLGGRVIVEAQPRPAGGTVAFVAGPSGEGIALQTWPLTDSSEAAQ